MIPESAPEVTLGCFEDFDQAEEMVSDLQDVFEKHGTQAELYIARTTSKSWLVYMTTFELDTKYIKRNIEKIEIGEDE